MKNNNKGFSMVEMIIVISIMAIILSVATLSISAAFSNEAKGCATEIGSLISKCKVNSLSRAGNTFVILETDDDNNIIGKYYESETLRETETLGNSKITISFVINGTTTYNLTEKSLALSFDRKTGGFMSTESIYDIATSKNPANELIDSGQYCTDIIIKAGGVTYKIDLATSTGGYSLLKE